MAQTAGPISSSIIGNGKRICFAAEVDSEVPRQLHRAPTPYPKELRNLARHARNLHHQSIHDQRVSTCCSFASNSFFLNNTVVLCVFATNTFMIYDIFDIVLI